MTKSAFVAIVGRPSAGKSTLLNTLCGQKISIVTPLPQTTRNKIRGILNQPEGQLVFVDTPGFHNSERKFNQRLRTLVSDTLDETDLVVYLLDGSRGPGEEERGLLDLLSKQTKPILLVLNKNDLATHPNWEAYLAEAKERGLKGQIFRVSAQTKDGLEQLTSAIYELAPEGHPMYPEDYYTDQDPEFRISEVIREQTMLRTRDEIPHSLYVDIADLEESNDGKELWIRAFIILERESQKGIVVGKGGTLIKEIRQESQKILGKIFPQRIQLDLRVKASPKWRNRDRVLRKLVR
ncbi:MAG: GTPase Era [Spirochaetales bacterium]|nr:GTPase Era [Spirochaetales bacterium]